MQVGNSRVKKILMGDKVVYQDSDGWIPLELPDGVKGSVMFKDNGDGTAGLLGAVTLDLSVKTTVLVPPQGYSFSSVNWNGGNGNTGAIAESGLGHGSGGTSLNAMPVVKDGNLLFYALGASTAVNVTIDFMSLLTNRSADAAGPAIVGIEKV